MAAGLQVALEPALAGVLAQDLHHPAVGRQMCIARRGRDRPDVGAVGRREDGAEQVRVDLVGADDAEVPVGSLRRIRSRR